jgi:PIN domain nuclease of toxin-antitoxin system
LASAGAELLPIEPKHIVPIVRLTLHHRYPFDRIRIAQAIAEGIPVIRSDTSFDAYGIKRIW